MASADYVSSASSALGEKLSGADANAKKDVTSWLSKIESGDKEVTDLKVSRRKMSKWNDLQAGFVQRQLCLQRGPSRLFSLHLLSASIGHFLFGLTSVFLLSSPSRPPLIRPRQRQILDKELTNKEFLVGDSLSLPDLSLLSLHHDAVSKSSAKEQQALPNATRYVSRVSQLAAKLPFDAASKYAAFDPAFEGQTAGEQTQGTAEAKPDALTGAKAKKEKKPKDEGATASKKKNNEPAAPLVPLPSHVDLRIGKIVDVKRHPDADALYLEQVDFAEPEGPRTILSGLVNFVPIEKMQDRLVVGVCNLKPASMRGIKSFGMLLCATHKDGKEHGVEPVVPPEGSQPGDRVYVEGFEGMEPQAQLNPKKKIFETIQPNYMTTDACECAWKGVGPTDAADAEQRPRLLRTEKGVCTAPGFASATLS